jgi:DNA polymerase (family X)
MFDPLNRQIAGRLEEAARLWRDQGADPFRVNAYLRAAETVRRWPQSVRRIFLDRGLEGLDALPGVGPAIAGAIRELIVSGRLPMLDRLRGISTPITVLSSVPSIGRRLAARLHDELGLNTLEELETAAHDGRLETIAGFGEKRLVAVRDSLAQRLGRVKAAPATAAAAPPVEELLDVDREYRQKATAGELPLIAPHRFNPTKEAWLPIFHTRRGDRRYTALFSNTGRAHRAGRTRDWVVLYGDDDAGNAYQYTVITAQRGPHRGARVVAGFENDHQPEATVAA